MSAICTENTDLHDWQWLTEPAQQAWLASPEALDANLLKLTTTLRKCHSPERTRLLLDLAELRRRARAKFRRADQMYFTRQGYEQATDEWIAAYKAQRFRGFATCVDLCSGIGGDALALAQIAPTTAVDRDPVTAWCCEQNLRLASEASAASRVLVADAETVSLDSTTAWHIDPDRRAGGQRVTNFDSLEPGPQLIAKLLEKSPHGAIKLAPATRLSDDWPYVCQREWIGRGGECRQQVAWHGGLCDFAGKRQATLINSPGHAVRTIVADPAPPKFRPEIGEYVYDVDSTVLAAGLVGPLAQGHSLTAWSASEGYLTGGLVDDHALAAFRVREVLPLRRGVVADWLLAHEVGILEIKHRLADFSLEQFRRELRLRGRNAATVLLAAQGARRVAVMADRIPRATQENA